jgi:glutathione S-transferase
MLAAASFAICSDTPARAASLFFGGETPLYADYAIFGQFQWARAISDFELLATDDPVAQWRTRLLHAFNGMALAAPAY